MESESGTKYRIHHSPRTGLTIYKQYSLRLVNQSRSHLLEEVGISVVRDRGQRQSIPFVQLLLDLVELDLHKILCIGTQRQSERRTGFLGNVNQCAADCE